MIAKHSLRTALGLAVMIAPIMATAAPTQLHWIAPKSRSTAVGLVASAGDLDFKLFFAACDPSRRTVSFERTGLIHAPKNPTLALTIAGTTYKLPGTVDEDIESGGFFLASEASYATPVIKAFIIAPSIRLTIDGRAEVQPTGGMKVASARFAKACRLR